MIRVLVVDDHAVVRAGLKQIISEVPDIVVAGEASNGQEALERALKEDYDQVLLDITLPQRDGIDVIKELRAQKPELRILVLSIHPEEQYALRVLKMGAAGYLTKESAPEELIAAIRKVSSGHKYISPALAEKLTSEFQVDNKLLHETLSVREFQIMCMIASGKRVKEIAGELFLSTKTIFTHRHRILQKMHMDNTTQLVRYVLENHLL